MAPVEVECSQCYKKVQNKEDALTCTGMCQRQYHPKCLNISASKLKIIKKDNKNKWTCYNCDLTREASGHGDPALKLILTKLDKLDEFFLQLKTLEKTVKELEASRDFDTKQLDFLKEQNKNLAKEIKVVVTKQQEMAAHVNSEKEEIIKKLTKNELIFQNLPIQNNKTSEADIKELVMKASHEISPNEVLLEEKDIKSVQLIPVKSKNSSLVIVKLSTPELCEKVIKVKKQEVPMLLAEALVEKVEDGKNYGTVYINFNHPKTVRELFFQARKQLKQRAEGKNTPLFKFVWISRDSKVLAKRSNDDRVEVIKSSVDIEKLVMG